MFNIKSKFKNHLNLTNKQEYVPKIKIINKETKPTPVEILVKNIEPDIITNQITNKGIIVHEDEKGKNKNKLTFGKGKDKPQKINHKKQYLPGQRLLEMIAKEKPDYIDNYFVKEDD